MRPVPPPEVDVPPEPDITSVRNDRVKDVAGLQRAKGRRATGRYLVEGPNAVGEVVADGLAEELFVVPEAADDWADAGVPVTVVTEHVLERLTDVRTPQGVVAVARIVTARLEDVVGTGVLVVCHEVADPGNAGAIVRTADAAGAAGVVLTTGSADVFAPKAVRSTTGSISHLPLVVDVSIDEVVAACRAAGQRLVGLDLGGDADVFAAGVVDPPVALVFGNEAHGLPLEVSGQLDVRTRVPMFGRAESLNLAAAVAVTVYEAARRTRPPAG